MRWPIRSPAQAMNPESGISRRKKSSGKFIDFYYKVRRFYIDGFSAYVSAMDVAKAMIELVEKQKFKQRYILAEGNYSFKEIASFVQNQFGRQEPNIKATRALLKIARYAEAFVSFFSGKKPALTKSLINSAFNPQHYSGEKIKKDLGFEYTPVKVTLEKVCKFYWEEKKGK